MLPRHSGSSEVDAAEDDDLYSHNYSPAEESDNPITFRPDVPAKECIIYFGLLKVGFEEKKQRRILCLLNIA